MRSRGAIGPALRTCAVELVRMVILLPATVGVVYAAGAWLNDASTNYAVPALAFGLIVTSILGLVCGGLPSTRTDLPGLRFATVLLLVGFGVGLWFAAGVQQVVGLGLILAVAINATLSRFERRIAPSRSPARSSY